MAGDGRDQVRGLTLAALPTFLRLLAPPVPNYPVETLPDLDTEVVLRSNVIS